MNLVNALDSKITENSRNSKGACDVFDLRMIFAVKTNFQLLDEKQDLLLSGVYTRSNSKAS